MRQSRVRSSVTVLAASLIAATACDPSLLLSKQQAASGSAALKRGRTPDPANQGGSPGDPKAVTPAAANQPVTSTILGLPVTSRVLSIKFLDWSVSSIRETVRFQIGVEVRDHKGDAVTGLKRNFFKAYVARAAWPTPALTATPANYRIATNELDMLLSGALMIGSADSSAETEPGRYDLTMTFTRTAYCYECDIDLKSLFLAVIVTDDFEQAALGSVAGLPSPLPHLNGGLGPAATKAPSASPTPASRGFELYAGTGYPDHVDGPRLSAQFDSIEGLAFGSDGTLYVADSGNRAIRKISPAGTVSTLVSSTALDYSVRVGAIVADAAGNLYMASECSITRISPSGAVFRVATPPGGVRWNAGIARSNDGTLYAADQDGNRLYKITSAGTVSLLAGSSSGEDDGTGTSAKFYRPFGLAVDGSGNILVADSGTKKIRKVTPTGTVTTVFSSTTSYKHLALTSAGDIVAGADYIEVVKITDGHLAGRVNYGSSIGAMALDGTDRLYIADHYGYKILRMLGDFPAIDDRSGDYASGRSGGYASIGCPSSSGGLSGGVSGGIDVAPTPTPMPTPMPTRTPIPTLPPMLTSSGGNVAGGIGR